MPDRKIDHINMAFNSRVEKNEADTRFYYEPMLASHHDDDFGIFNFAGKQMRLPFWVSSMTGGTQMAAKINENLARVCGEFGLGMGLGSCRALLYDDQYLSDFKVREFMGDQTPFYANLGIAQLEQLIKKKEIRRIEEMVNKLDADGLIIHVNPLQEAFQPEGDIIKIPPIETLEEFLTGTSLRIIVKEVGQGMGPESLKRLLNLPLEAIEFGALGGTNFTRLEQTRFIESNKLLLGSFGNVGHTALEMTQMVNQLVADSEPKCTQLIISGGISSITDGYYLQNLSQLTSVIGMGSAFLKHAMDDYGTIQKFVSQLKQGWGIASHFLVPK